MAGDMPEPVGEMAGEGRWRKTNRVWIPELDTVAHEEIERIKREIDLEARAAEDGRNNRPPHSDTRLNEIQLDLCSKVYSGILLLNQFLAEQVDLALKHVRAMMPDRLDAESVKDECEREINRVFGDEHSHLVELKRKELEAGRYLRFFRHKNRIHHEADYPASLIKLIAILFAMFLGESLINGSLFAEISTTGLMGGAVFAGMISAINIVLGLMAGYVGWRYSGHVAPLQKSIGVFVTMACHSAAMTWNLLVAHFREAAEIIVARDDISFDFSQMREATFNHIEATGWLGIDSLQSWALLLIGVIIHFISAREGWDEIADRYPDYKQADQRAVRTRENFEFAMADLRDDIRDGVEDIEERAKSTVALAQQAERDAAMLLDQAEQRRAEVRDSEDEWVNGGNRLLRTYREINTDIRDKDTTPSYFKHFPTAADYRQNNFDGSPAKKDVAERTKAVQTALAEIEALKKQAHDTAEAGQDVLREIGRHITHAMDRVDARIELEGLAIREEAERAMAEQAGPIDSELAAIAQRSA